MKLHNLKFTQQFHVQGAVKGLKMVNILHRTWKWKNEINQCPYQEGLPCTAVICIRMTRQVVINSCCMLSLKVPRSHIQEMDHKSYLATLSYESAITPQNVSLENLAQSWMFCFLGTTLISMSIVKKHESSLSVYCSQAPLFLILCVPLFRHWC